MTSEPAQPAVLATAPPPVPGRATAPARGLPTGPGQAITNSVGIKLAYIPPGEFMMGSPSSESGRFDDELQHRVRLTRPFYIGITPVTQQQWEAVMGSTPSSFNGGDRPVEQVSWDDAVNFCKRLSKKEGKRYRLPTEAEWEYACRAGTTGPYGGTGRLEDMGWFADNSGDARLDSAQIWTTDRANYIKRLEDNHCRTHSVGQKYANGWGLYDMHGNVWEWCDDWYGDYSAGAANDPKGLPTGWDRVLRGGSWYRDPQLCRSACRFRDTPDVRDVCIIGFRLALDFP